MNASEEITVSLNSRKTCEVAESSYFAQNILQILNVFIMWAETYRTNVYRDKWGDKTETYEPMRVKLGVIQTGESTI